MEKLRELRAEYCEEEQELYSLINGCVRAGMQRAAGEVQGALYGMQWAIDKLDRIMEVDYE